MLELCKHQRTASVYYEAVYYLWSEEPGPCECFVIFGRDTLGSYEWEWLTSKLVKRVSLLKQKLVFSLFFYSFLGRNGSRSVWTAAKTRWKWTQRPGLTFQPYVSNGFMRKAFSAKATNYFLGKRKKLINKKSIIIPESWPFPFAPNRPAPFLCTFLQ